VSPANSPLQAIHLQGAQTARAQIILIAAKRLNVLIKLWQLKFAWLKN